MANYQANSLSFSQQISNSQPYTSMHHSLDFTGDKNATTTDSWSVSGSGQFHLNHVDSFRFRTSLVEIVEELKLRRKNEVENEARTQMLIKEKYELERKNDLDATRIKNIQEENDKNLAETKRKFEEKMRTLEEKIRQDGVQKEVMEKEMEAMKDELQKLQLSKYSLEKSLRDQERKVQIQSDSTEQHLQQLSRVEHKLQAFSAYCNKLVDSQGRLDSQVKEAINLNQTLKYVNEHQKCLIGRNQEVISSLEIRLLEANKKLQDKPSVSAESQLKLDVAQLTQQLDGRKTKVEILEKEVEELKSRCNENLAKLQDSYTLIERHLANASSHRDEAGALREEKKDLESKCEALKGALDTTHRELDIQISVHQQAVEQWDKKSTETTLEIDRLKNDLDLSSNNCQQLEELNSNWAKHNLELSTNLQEAMAKLEVPKYDTEVQTIVSLFDVKDSSCQTSVEVVTVPTQTDALITHPALTQTYSPALTTNHTQTLDTPHQVASTQTRVAPVANMSVMATTDMADRGVQTLPVRVYQEFSDKICDLTKDAPDHGKETIDQSRGQIRIKNDLPSGESMLTTMADSCKNIATNKCSTVDVKQKMEQNTMAEPESADNNTEDTTDDNANQDKPDTSTIQGMTEKHQQDISSLIHNDLSENLSQETAEKTSSSSRPPTEDKHEASCSTYRQQGLASEERLDGNCLQKPTKENTVDVNLSEKSEVLDEIIEIESPESPNNPNHVESNSTDTAGILELRPDAIVQEDPGNSCLISSYRGFSHQIQEGEGKESASPRYSPLSLSLRKPRIQTKRLTMEQNSPVEESSTGTKRHKNPRGKFTLNSEKSGILFEGKTLLSAYMSSRNSTGTATNKTSSGKVTEKRQETSRNTVDRRQTGGQKSVTDARHTRYSYVAETRKTCINTDKPEQTDTRITRSLGKMDGSDITNDNQIKVPYTGLTESTGQGMPLTEPSEKLSPYSRYSAMFRSRVVGDNTVNSSQLSTRGGKFQYEGQTVVEQNADQEKISDSVRGILKGVSERKVHTRNVRFTEGPPETQIIQECMGDQLLFSDSEEDVCEENDRFVSLDEEDSGEAKRRKLE